MRVVLGLLIATIGFVAALAPLMLFLSLPALRSPLERVGSVLLLVLIETVLGFTTYHAFGKVMGSTPRDKGGV
jgi:hypothetical protein